MDREVKKCCDTCNMVNCPVGSWNVVGWINSKDYCSRWEEKEVSEVDKLTEILIYTQIKNAFGEDHKKQMEESAKYVLQNYVSKEKLLEYIKGQIHYDTWAAIDVISFVEKQTNGDE